MTRGRADGRAGAVTASN